jgi:hypothetical protein
LEDRRNVGEGSFNSGDGTHQRVQSLMFMMMMMMMNNLLPMRLCDFFFFFWSFNVLYSVLLTLEENFAN